jgi:hypothetical protein
MASYEYLGDGTFRDKATGRTVTTAEFERLKAAKSVPVQAPQAQAPQSRLPAHPPLLKPSPAPSSSPSITPSAAPS